LLYKYINNQLIVKDSIKALRKDDGFISHDKVEITNILNKCFQDVFVIEEDGALPNFESRVKSCAAKFSDLSPNEISYDDVLNRLQSLKENKAFGPDKLHPVMLKNSAEAFALPLTLIFRESLASSQLPIQFKSANITPLFKKGDKAVAANYRPVSLTSVVCKILEGIILTKIENHFYKNNFLSEHQHGFIKKKSCTTNLLETIDFITLNIENHTPVDVVLLDFAKAFDTVAHNRLFLKLKGYGIDGLVLKWIASFLRNRRQRVVMGEIVSNWVDVFSGVPQGSVIGPFLFVIYINDFPDTIKNISKLYADDTKILSIVNSDLCVKEIQDDLNKAFEWTQDWLLNFNINKCVVMHYGSNNKNYPFFINNIQLQDSESERDLGIIFSTNLKWKNHVTMITSKANQMLGRIKKSFARFDCKLMRSLYLTFIRPLLEFAVPVWSPYMQGDCNAIEKVQRRVTKLVSSISSLKYEDRLIALGLTTLTERRKRGDLIELYKLMHGIEKINSGKSFPLVKNCLRGNCFKYHKEFAKHPSREHFLFNRVANAWNLIPTEVVTAKSVNCFKGALDCWLRSNQA
jgi:hypothetical protein